MNIFIQISAFIMLTSMVFPQGQLTGDLHLDSKLILTGYNQQHKYIPVSNSKKSPLLGGLFSLLLPGAGEFYSGEYLKAGVFLAAEVAVITTALIYDNKGDDQTNKFQNYADENWSVVKYAEWLNEFEDADIQIDYTTPGLKSWERVNWDELNSYEHGSHTLPPHGDQQYYELIGKYQQYTPGWNDFNSNSSELIMSHNFLFYSGMRGEANDFYNVASKAVILLYVNHFVSMLDGVWSAIQFNKNIAFNVRIEENIISSDLEFIPTFNLSISF